MKKSLQFCRVIKNLYLCADLSKIYHNENYFIMGDCRHHRF